MLTIDDLRADLGETWCRVLRLDAVSGHADFLELGGSSLAAAHIIAIVQEKYGVLLDITHLLDSEDLDQFAQAVYARLRAEG
jgi:acyl carrier protein